MVYFIELIRCLPGRAEPDPAEPSGSPGASPDRQSMRRPLTQPVATLQPRPLFDPQSPELIANPYPSTIGRTPTIRCTVCRLGSTCSAAMPTWAR